MILQLELEHFQRWEGIASYCVPLINLFILSQQTLNDHLDG